jgi:hypothetical protein
MFSLITLTPFQQVQPGGAGVFQHGTKGLAWRVGARYRLEAYATITGARPIWSSDWALLRRYLQPGGRFLHHEPIRYVLSGRGSPGSKPHEVPGKRPLKERILLGIIVPDDVSVLFIFRNPCRPPTCKTRRQNIEVHFSARHGNPATALNDSTLSLKLTKRTRDEYEYQKRFSAHRS